jgi:hypothetical protein
MDEESRPDREDIERRAYRRFEERGRTHGDDQTDWLEAEREAREEAHRRRDEGAGGEQVTSGGGTRGKDVERATIDEEAARASGTGPTSGPTGTGPVGNVRTPGTAVTGGPTESGR